MGSERCTIIELESNPLGLRMARWHVAPSITQETRVRALAMSFIIEVQLMCDIYTQ